MIHPLGQNWSFCSLVQMQAEKHDVLFMTVPFESGSRAVFSVFVWLKGRGEGSAFSAFPNIYDAATVTVN